MNPIRLLAATVALVFAVGLLAAPPAKADPTPAGATWRETYISTPDGESLHTDVMRPVGLTDADKTPVILIVSPYIGEASGPNNRFFDFIEGAKVFQRGYSVVMVSLRGSGGSSGCLDILGPGEQTDVVTAVRWAATQPWSTGRVGMYGKSYDANTGVVGAALQPPGLEAVVAQQIAPDRYRGSYSDRVRLLQSLLYPSVTYGVGAEAQGYPGRQTDATYTGNAMSRSADCQAWLGEHYLDDESSRFWTPRDFVERAKGSRVPTFVTTGYLDNPTNIGAGAIDFYNALSGPKRLWVGWWDHVRGNDTVRSGSPTTFCTSGDDCVLAMGRQGFFDEVMAFYDEHLKGIKPTGKPAPPIAAQGSDGKWRAEESFPPADAVTLTSRLLSGAYADDGRNVSMNDTGFGPGGTGSLGPKKVGDGVWTFSPPLSHRAHVNGVPDAVIDVAPKAPRSNLVVVVYDVDETGKATAITRGAALVDGAGSKKLPLWPTDWTFEPGHRVGVLVTGADAETYAHVPTQTTVTVTGGRVNLPFLSRARSGDLEGAPAPRLESYRSRAPFAVSQSTIDANTNRDFTLPPAQQ